MPDIPTCRPLLAALLTACVMAAPGTTVDIWVHDSEASLQVTACDESPTYPCNGYPLGTWHADFTGQIDLQPGSNGAANQCDQDGDCTYARWQLRNHRRVSLGR